MDPNYDRKRYKKHQRKAHYVQKQEKGIVEEYPQGTTYQLKKDPTQKQKKIRYRPRVQNKQDKISEEKHERQLEQNHINQRSNKTKHLLDNSDKNQKISLVMSKQIQNKKIKQDKKKEIDIEFYRKLFAVQLSNATIKDSDYIIQHYDKQQLCQKFKQFIAQNNFLEQYASKLHIILKNLVQAEIHIFYIYLLLSAFKNISDKIIQSIKQQEIIMIMKNLRQNCPVVIQIINIFDLNVKEHSIAQILQRSLVQSKFEDISILRRQLKVISQQFFEVIAQILRANKKKDVKKWTTLIVNVIKEKKYNVKNYQYIVDDLQKKSMIYFMRSQGWQYAEEIFRSRPKILLQLVLTLHANRRYKQFLSICSRNSYLIPRLPKHLKKFYDERNNEEQVLRNFLHTDKFAPSTPQHLHLVDDFGIHPKNVIFIHQKSPNLQNLMQIVQKASIIGLDTQSVCIRTEFSTQLETLSLIQISIEDKVLILDAFKMNNEHINKAFNTFFLNPKNKIIGHSMQIDFKYLLKALKVKQAFCEVVQLKTLYLEHYKNGRIGLASMSQTIFGKKLCKVYTLTDWGRRPLLSNQLHYAALDAVIVVKIWEKLIKIKPINDI